MSESIDSLRYGDNDEMYEGNAVSRGNSGFAVEFLDSHKLLMLLRMVANFPIEDHRSSTQRSFPSSKMLGTSIAEGAGRERTLLMPSSQKHRSKQRALDDQTTDINYVEVRLTGKGQTSKCTNRMA